VSERKFLRDGLYAQSKSAQTARKSAALYASIGPELTQYDVDVDRAELHRRGSVILPANVHYSWPHASGRYLYVASSDSSPGMGATGDRHHVTAFRIDPASSALTPDGDPIRLPTRPIHMTTDIPSRHLLVAFSNPSAIRVYRVNPDMTPGEEIRQPGTIEHARRR
jgi:6-phosphogluconolactonase